MSALNSRVYDDLLPMLRETGLADELRREGALTLYESEDGYRRDAVEWACKRARGMVVEDMTAAQARALEPALGPLVHRAVFTPQWSHVSDPRRIVRGLEAWLVAHGIEIRPGEVRNIVRGSVSSSLELELAGQKSLLTDMAVVAAGAWSGTLARRIGDPVLLESERGYNMTLPSPGVQVTRELIFAERKFVATPLSCGLRIGGAAEFGGLNARPNFKRSRVLVELAQRYLPELQPQGATSWAGHRPATPDSLPVIGPSRRRPNVFYAFGHGHLGLTQAATTGRLVSDLILSKPQVIDLAPYGIERFAAPKEFRNVTAHIPLH